MTMKKYFKSYNRKYLLLPIISLLLVCSCSENILEEKPLDFLAPENAYSSIPGIQQGITGLHTLVRADFYTDGPNQDFFAIWLASIGTDVTFHGENPGGNRKFVNYLGQNVTN